MKITFGEALSRKTWLQKELMQSLNDECFNCKEAIEKQEWDVKLVVNGVDVEPKWFNSIMTKLEEHIDVEAKILFERHLEDIQGELETKTKKLLDDIQDIHDDLINGYKPIKKG
jgi:hypothetical protein